PDRRRSNQFQPVAASLRLSRQKTCAEIARPCHSSASGLQGVFARLASSSMSRVPNGAQPDRSLGRIIQRKKHLPDLNSLAHILSKPTVCSSLISVDLVVSPSGFEPETY